MSSPKAERQTVELANIIQQAVREGWTELAIASRSAFRDRLIEKGWQPDRVLLMADPIGEEGVQRLVQLKGLTTLDLAFNGIGDEEAQALAQLKGLTTLSLASNRIGDEGARALAQLTGQS